MCSELRCLIRERLSVPIKMSVAPSVSVLGPGKKGEAGLPRKVDVRLRRNAVQGQNKPRECRFILIGVCFVENQRNGIRRHDALRGLYLSTERHGNTRTLAMPSLRLAWSPGADPPRSACPRCGAPCVGGCSGNPFPAHPPPGPRERLGWETGGPLYPSYIELICK